MQKRIFAFLITLLSFGVLTFAVQAPDDVSQRIAAEVAARGLLADASDTLKTQSEWTYVYEGPAALEKPIVDELSRETWQLTPGTNPQLLVRATQDSMVALSVEHGDSTWKSERRVGKWWALFPPLLAVLVALYFRALIPALLGAVVIGGAIGAPTLVEASYRGLGHIWTSVTDSFNINIILFTIALVGMVHIITRGGGVQGIVNRVRSLARSARSTRLAAVFMGGAVFFDDYANTFVVGTTMRPLTDAQRISREKLAYIVDSTSAPIAGIAVVSTWIGYEVGLFDEISRQLALGQSGYEIFFAILPLRFYCIGALIFVLLNAYSGRDFGPMLKAERRTQAGQIFNPESKPLARSDSELLEPKPDKPTRWQNAAIPVLSVIFAVFIGMFWSGWSRGDLSIPSAFSGEFGAIFSGWGHAFRDLGSFSAWRDAFSNADNALVLFVSAAIGSLIAFALVVSQRILTPAEAGRAWIQSGRTMAEAILILILAWSIRAVCDDLGTSIYLVGVVQDLISPTALPLITFLLAAVVGFSTGTSWGTMGILLPAMVPMAAFLTHGQPGSELIVFLCFGAVLDGAIFGDHCSPISDTTVMSSIASGADLMDHVRTQAPYAIITMVLAALGGYVGVALGLPIWLAYVGIIVGSAGALYLLGTNVDRPEQPKLVD